MTTSNSGLTTENTENNDVSLHLRTLRESSVHSVVFNKIVLSLV